jgi:hypothetical protein
MTLDDALKLGIEFIGVSAAVYASVRTARHEDRALRERQHKENREEMKEQTTILHALDRRTTILETMIEPLHDWWNRGGGGSDGGAGYHRS